MAGKKKGRFLLRMFGTWQVTQERFQCLEVKVMCRNIEGRNNND